MKGALRSLGAANVIGAVAVALTVAIGVLLRLEDPLSSTVVPAEDPYTHMVLVKEHLRTGTLDPLNPPGGLYPPGMHAYLAVLWSFTGASLYELVRFAPAAFGGVGVAGVALLLWRQEGRVAAFVGALTFALAPELVFRSSMLAPTAVDLALIPFLFLALLEVLDGKLAWVGVAAPVSVYLVFAHPWLFGVIGAMGVAFAVLALVLPWPSSRSPSLSSPGFAAAMAIVGGSLGLVLSTCAGMCGSGFEGVLPYADLLVLASPLVLVLSFLPSVLIAVTSRDLDDWMPRRTSGARSTTVRAGLSLVFATALVAVTWPAVQQGLPDLVDLQRMLGWPLLALAAFAFVTLPFTASRVAYLGGSLAMATYPMVVYNPLGSAFWPHRTVVYLAIGLVLLVGVAGGALARWTREAWDEHVVGRSPLDGRLDRPLVALVPVLLVAGSLGGALWTATPPNYPDGWYRLYEPCEMDALQDISDRAEQDPRAVVVGGDWRPAIVTSAITENPDRVWYKDSFWADERERRDTMALMAEQNRPLYVVEERYMRSDNPQADSGVLEGEDWRVVDTWCTDELNPRHEVVLHEMEGRPG
jgi:hypothetical protein